MILASFGTTFTGSRTFRRPLPLAALAAPFASAATQLRRWQNRRRTERALEGMPLDLRKDIGWPSAAPPERRARSTRSRA
ncbi:hypothetical protein [Ciceribacter ferrooxidans]|uniref:DUF1127 domain-containing protein n=1 Tax=Ciceribacter ferrooxidans TaxID=2509717 RepID=A0A4Q2TWX2_9HYPH|nr:hypothetical protein [Ciceribacter ferrooxidans]RYC23683.1 hypothetical protein EUU22_02930 [Ciceribacter ferrooxidans]